MTQQTPDTLVFKGKKTVIFEEPLASYKSDTFPKPDFFPKWTSNWRGYVATWEIDANKLYLIDIKAWIPKTDQVKSLSDIIEKVGLDEVFPGCDRRIFAIWYTGKISIPWKAPQRKYFLVDFGYGPVYEPLEIIEQVVHIKRGNITKEDFFNHSFTYRHLFKGLRNKFVANNEPIVDEKVAVASGKLSDRAQRLIDERPFIERRNAVRRLEKAAISKFRKPS